MPRFDGTGPPDGGSGWGRGPCGMGLARGRSNWSRRGAAPQGRCARPFAGRRGWFSRDFAMMAQETPSAPWEGAEQLKRDLAAAREEVAELENRLKDLEEDKS